MKIEIGVPARAARLLAVALCVLVGPGCGGSSSPSTPSAPQATPAPPPVAQAPAVIDGWNEQPVAAEAEPPIVPPGHGVVVRAPGYLPREQVYAGEVFGPVAVLSRFSDFDDALAEVNDSVYGLQAGIFTRDIYKAHRAWDVLEVGGVVIGDVPSWRVDHMPYGGVKESGLGREGIRFAIEDMTEVRLLVVRKPLS